MTAPDESVTEPRMAPVVCCAQANAGPTESPGTSRIAAARTASAMRTRDPHFIPNLLIFRGSLLFTDVESGHDTSRRRSPSPLFLSPGCLHHSASDRRNDV